MRVLWRIDKGKSHASNAPIPRALQEPRVGKPEGGQQTPVPCVSQAVHKEQRRQVSHFESPHWRPEVSLQYLREKIQGETDKEN